LDKTIRINYRPISNLPLIEKAVFNQLNKFFSLNGYFDHFQFLFQFPIATQHRETALIKIINDNRLNTDTGKLSVLVLLDLSAAFDTVDHDILLDRLENWVGLSGIVLGPTQRSV